MSQFVIRCDDITPSMDWRKFNYLKEPLIKYNIKPIIGVVPHCLDEKLNINLPEESFWSIIRSLASNGWVVAQHGYTHQYISSNSGLLKINSRSEFSGLDYTHQLNKLKRGKQILEREHVWQPVFMAPAHSFDNNTLKALSHLNFQYITDGYGVYPYQMGKLKALPNLFSTPKHIGIGIYTICLHTNSMNKKQLDNIINFIINNRDKIITFDQALSSTPPSILIDRSIRYLTSISLRNFRKIR